MERVERRLKCIPELPVYPAGQSVAPTGFRITPLSIHRQPPCLHSPQPQYPEKEKAREEILLDPAHVGPLSDQG